MHEAHVQAMLTKAETWERAQRWQRVEKLQADLRRSSRETKLSQSPDEEHVERMSCCSIMIDPDLVQPNKRQGITSRSECAVVATTVRHVDGFVFVRKEGNHVWETARKRLPEWSIRRTEASCCLKGSLLTNCERYRFQVAVEKKN